ncbi:MAG: sigma factor, partial [Planctomycetota bacterium]
MTHPDGAADPGLTDALLREAGWVRALARRLARDQAAADDAAQGALALALQKRPDPGRGLRPWLARVVARLARRD